MNLRARIQPSLRDSTVRMSAVDPGTEVPGYSQMSLRGSTHKVVGPRTSSPKLSRTPTNRPGLIAAVETSMMLPRWGFRMGSLGKLADDRR